MHDLYSTQIEWIQAIHQIRSPIIDCFFTFFDFFDRQEFIFILVPAVWMGYRWKVGLKLFYVLLLSGICNYALKQVFELPRPFYVDPALGVIQVAGYGFPSGAAQSAILLPGILLYYYRKKWGWIVAANFFFWISLSRVYLGIHFPTDILGGWMVGILLLAVFIYVFPRIEKWLDDRSLRTLLWISQVIPLGIVAIVPILQIARLGFVASGVGLGVAICGFYQIFLNIPKTRGEMFLRAFLGAAGIFILYYLMLQLPIENKLFKTFIQFFPLGVWLGLGSTLSWRGFRKLWRF